MEERKIRDADEGTEQYNGYEHHHGGLTKLANRRPGGLLQLSHGLPVEDPDTAEWIFHKLFLAGQEGLEPPTDGFGDRNSTN